jgi:16S rRNA (guanine527-N7)-methyltransferase
VNSRDFQDRLLRRAKKAGVSTGPELSAGLESYFKLLASWNEKVNLTGLDLRDPTPETLDRLLIEPLVAVKHVPPETTRIIDIGSGGGSPSIPMALVLRKARVSMVESKVRKSVFLREVVRTLELKGCEVLTARFEELLSRPELHEQHDLLTIRAVRTEGRVLMSVQAFVKPGGEIFLFRSAGRDSADVLAPPLVWKSTNPLVESLRSQLVVLRKREMDPA